MLQYRPWVGVLAGLWLEAGAWGAPALVATTSGMVQQPQAQGSATLAADARADEASIGVGASSSGDLELSRPLELPPFRGLEPRVSLEYSSARTSGFAGAGWELSGFGVVERLGAAGLVPTYSGTDVFALDGNRLIPCASVPQSPSCAAGGNYAVTNETFVKILRNPVANTWTVVRKNGSYDVYAPIHTTSLGVFRWGIASSSDTHGNRVDFGWVTAGGVPYPRTIRYNRTVVTFYLEPRPDPIAFPVGTAALALQSQRLRSVDVQVNGQRARAYRLFYNLHTAATTFPRDPALVQLGTLFSGQEDSLRSKLYAIRKYGSDAVVDTSGVVTAGTVDPEEVVYLYDELGGGLSISQLRDGRRATMAGIQGSVTKEETYGPYATGPSSCILNATGTQFAGDFNGDGITDVGCYDPLGQGGLQNPQVATLLLRGSHDHRGATDASTLTHWTLPRAGWCSTGKIVAVDYNHDERVDLACITAGTSGSELAVSNGTQIAAPLLGGCAPLGLGQFEAGSPQLACGASRLERIELGAGRRFEWGRSAAAELFRTASKTLWADFDGDGLDDIAIVDRDFSIRVLSSTGLHLLPPRAGDPATPRYLDFGAAVQWAPAGFCEPNFLFAGDVNGDGLQDLYCGDRAPTEALWVALSNGRGTFSRQPGKFNTDAAGSALIPLGLGDVDGDGRADLLSWQSGTPLGAGVSEVWVALSDGISARPSQKWAVVQAGAGAGREAISLGDYNRDGRVDILTSKVWTDVRQNALFKMADALQRDRITAVQSPGALTRIEYTSTGQLAVGDIPLRPVVTKVAGYKLPGLVAGRTSAYSYSGGVYSRSERRFRGFATVREETIAGPGSPSVVKTTSFRMDPGFPGRPSRVEVKMLGSGELRSVTDLTYQPDAAPPYVNLLSRQIVHDHVGGAQRSTQTDYAYDAYGNPTRTTFFGDPSLASDPAAKVTVQTYTYNPALFIVDRAAVETTYAGRTPVATEVIAQSRSYYDNATSLTAPPTHGDLTRLERWIQAGVYESTSFGHDSLGNVERIVSPDHGYTQTTYDALFHLFPIRIERGNDVLATVPKLVSTADWSTPCGAILHDTSEANVTHTLQYDPLCRHVSITGPEGFERTTYCHARAAYFQYYAEQFGEFSCLSNTLTVATTNQMPLASDGLAAALVNAVRVVARERPGSAAGSVEFSMDYFDSEGRVVEKRRSGPAPGQAIRVVNWYGLSGLTLRKYRPTYQGAPTPAFTLETEDLDTRTHTTAHPDGTTTTVRRTAPNTSVKTDRRGVVRTLLTDSAGVVVEERYHSSGVAARTRHIRDPLGRLTGLIDGRNVSFSYDYDGLGRLVSVSDPDSGPRTLAYSRLANGGTRQTATELRTGTSRVCDSYFDVFGRQTSETCREGGATETRQHVFSGPFLRTRAWPKGSETYAYDLAGRLREKVTSYLDVTPAEVYTTTFGYDRAGRQAWVSYPDGDTLGTPAAPIQYDAAGRPKVLPGVVANATYRADGALDLVTFASGGVTEDLGYDVEGRLTDVLMSAGSTKLLDLDYGVSAGRIDTIRSVAAPTANRTYHYDDLSRLDQQNARAWRHDAASAIESFSLGAVGRPPTNHRPTAIGGLARTYDPFGQLGDDAVSGLHVEWNTFGEADRVVHGTSTMTFGYGSGGERVWSRVNGGAATRYPSPDLRASAGVLTKTIRIGTRVVAVRVGQMNYFAATDHQGSIRLLTTAAGAVAMQAHYDAYGLGTFLGPAGASITNTWGVGYLGERLDTPSGLYYLHARYYDPRAEHFLSPDHASPERPEVGSARYSYSGGDPVNSMDPGGEFMTTFEWLYLGSLAYQRYLFPEISPPRFVGVDISVAGGLGLGKNDFSLGGGADLTVDTSGRISLFYSGGFGQNVGGRMGFSGLGAAAFGVFVWPSQPPEAGVNDVVNGDSGYLQAGNFAAFWNPTGIGLGYSPKPGLGWGLSSAKPAPAGLSSSLGLGSVAASPGPPPAPSTPLASSGDAGPAFYTLGKLTIGTPLGSGLWVGFPGSSFMSQFQLYGSGIYAAGGSGVSPGAYYVSNLPPFHFEEFYNNYLRYTPPAPSPAYHLDLTDP